MVVPANSTLHPQRLIDGALSLGAAHAAVTDVERIRFSLEFRRLCEENKCGSYNANWMCPPLVGDLDALRARTIQYGKCLVFQTIHPIAHSRDWTGMSNAFPIHDEVLRRIVSHFTDTLGMTDLIRLGAGPCRYCPRCCALDEAPCSFPEKAIASLESYGIDVGSLLELCGIPYSHGENTVSYVGCILFTS